MIKELVTNFALVLVDFKLPPFLILFIKTLSNLPKLESSLDKLVDKNINNITHIKLNLINTIKI